MRLVNRASGGNASAVQPCPPLAGTAERVFALCLLLVLLTHYRHQSQTCLPKGRLAVAGVSKALKPLFRSNTNLSVFGGFLGAGESRAFSFMFFVYSIRHSSETSASGGGSGWQLM